MSYQADREIFIARMAHEGLGVPVARALLRAASTLQRLAEAQCNGDWPADNGERATVECPICGCLWAPSTVKAGKCPDCRTEARIKAEMPEGWTIQTQGDPRGAVLRVIPPSYAERNAGRDCFNLDAIGVPTRG